MNDKVRNSRLKDSDLEAVSGGTGEENKEFTWRWCPVCNDDNPKGRSKFRLVSGGRARCTVCGQWLDI